MSKKAIIIAVFLVVAVFVCGSVLTSLQSRVDFPEELQMWYSENADTVHHVEWLAEHGFEYNAVLEGYNRQFLTTGGYTSVTIFDATGTADATHFEADHDYYDMVEQYTYQFTIGTEDEDYVWINLYADNKVNANMAVKEITEQLNNMT